MSAATLASLIRLVAAVLLLGSFSDAGFLERPAWSQGPPAASTGQLVITTQPEGGNVSVDAEPLGPAPVVKRDLQPGEHLVEAKWPDGKKLKQIARVTAGSSTVVQLGQQASAPQPPAPQRPSPETRSGKVTFIRLHGPEANEDKQHRCEMLAYDKGWVVDDTAPFKADIKLEGGANELVVTYNELPLEKRALNDDRMEKLCLEALGRLARAITLPRDKLPVARRLELPTATSSDPCARNPKRAPPGEPDLQAAVEAKRALLLGCRDAYAKEISTLAVEVTVECTGAVSDVALVEVDPSSRFANCALRALKQLVLPGYQGANARVSATLRLAVPAPAGP